MQRALIILFSFLFPFTGFCQSKLIGKFDKQTHQFSGSKVEQAKLLLRPVKPLGLPIQDKVLDNLPDFLNEIFSGNVSLPEPNKMTAYIISNQLTGEEIGGSILSPISKNSKGTKAKYLVIHDTSIELSKLDDVQNTDEWRFNDVKRTFFKSPVKKVEAHIYIGRTGKTYSQIGFHTPWRATKFENNILEESISKGLFINVELVQPRTKGPLASWYYVAPTPGFTDKQYEKLALVYFITSFRAKDWLVPVFHRVLDDDIKGAHDDPQNFELEKFDKALRKVFEDITK